MIGVKERIPGVVYAPLDRLMAYVEAGELRQTTLVEALCESFERNAERTALCSADGDVSYSKLDDLTNRFAAALLEIGAKPLDRVLFQAANSPELLYAFIGCLKAGLIPVCTLAAHREREIGYIGCHTDAVVHIVQGDDAKFDLASFALKMQPQMPTLRHIISIRGGSRPGVQRLEDLIATQDSTAAREVLRKVPRDPYQCAIFQLSGGTTGVPKVIPRMQNDYLLNAARTAEWLGFRNTDVMFNPLQMIHNACMVCAWVPILLSGGAFAIASEMTPEAWGWVFREKRPTWIGLIRPVIPCLEAMLDQSLGTLESVIGCWCPDSARLTRQRFGIPSYAMFGMSEGMNMYTQAGDPDEALDWSVGRPLSRFDEVRLIRPGTNQEAEVGEIGELICRGPYTLSGYYNAPERNREAFTADGFYKTGDLMVKKPIGGTLYYSFAGRTKDVVDRGTEKVNCEEVEIAVCAHDAIAVCAVVGMPDARLGERICAYVVLKQGARGPDVLELGRFLQGAGLAKFKWPERIEIIEALPIGKSGKLDKGMLRKDIAEKLAGEQGIEANIAVH